MRCIYILSMGSIEHPLLRLLSKEVSAKLRCRCKIIDSLDEPTYAYDPDRDQFLSAKILREILNNKQLCSSSKGSGKILGIVDVDLCTPILTFVFGEAQLGGKAAIVSLCRLRQEFYGLPANHKLLVQRIKKEVLHELGHTFGLVHCPNPRCVMYFSNSVRNIDGKTVHFCSSCSRLLTEKT